MPGAYCGECEWQYRVDGDGDGDEDRAKELSRAMIDHFVETGHSPVERCDADDRLASDADSERSDQARAGESLERSREKPTESTTARRRER
ncbi:hypothetical protein [Natrinema salifodinae]|uniref:Uncharacterized protein n=1 Tax=Natrinema salifodinae TaxID=1202768 RepID=A0A1I0PPQ0_9EURY|nr:hypothetical protein [Natrinema salifodinae]SEW15808.1 hypothetical protein SAMN05216285_2749 [Natrinema salifodinae]